MKNFFFLILGLILIFGSIYLFLQSEPKRFQSNPDQTLEIREEVVEKRAFIGNVELLVEMADTDQKRVQGLSSRESLEEGRGMLFVFENEGKHGFWMKDMLFSIDILWLDENLRVVDLKTNVRPETFPEIFYPDRAIKYVLELPAGFSEKNSIDRGVVMYFEEENLELSPVGSE